MTGGYKMIDLGNKSLSTTKVVIKGIYDKIESTKKPILLENINIGGTEYHNAYATFEVSSTDYVADIYGYTITVTDDDEVTATAIV